MSQIECVLIATDKGDCLVVNENGRQAVYRDGVCIGWIVTTETPKPKVKKSRPAKPNKGPIAKQKWLQ